MGCARRVHRALSSTWKPALILLVGLSQAGVLIGLAAPFLYRPLPYTDSPSLIVPLQVNEEGLQRSLTSAAFRRIRERSDLFDQACGHRYSPPLLTTAGSRRLALRAVVVTPNLLACLGLDRGLLRIDVEGNERGVVLRHAAATRLFSADVSPVGRLLRLQDGSTLRVAAVLSEGQLLPMKNPVDALVIESDALWRRSEDDVIAVCRLRSGVTIGQATAALAADASLADPRLTIGVVDLKSWLTTKVRRLAVWSAATGLLLFALSVFSACGLIGTRASERLHRWFVQRALGAVNSRLGADLLREAWAMGALAGAGSVAIAWAVLKYLNARVPAELLQMGGLRLDIASGTIMMVLAQLGALLAQTPSVWLLRPRTTGRNAAEHPSLTHLRRVMIVGESILAMLFVGVGSILLKSQVVMLTQDLGVSLDTTVVSVLYPAEQADKLIQNGIEQTLQRFNAVPGTRAAAAAQGVMYDSSSVDTVVRRPGAKSMVGVRVKSIQGAYVKAGGGRLVSGREIAANAPRLSEVLVNEALARRLWPGTNATGEAILVAGGSSPSAVVGVLADAFEEALDSRPVPTLYVAAATWYLRGLPVHYLIDGRGLTEPIVTKLLSDMPGEPAVVAISTVRERLSETVRDKSFAALVWAVVAVSALLLAWSGAAVVISHAVSRRKRELAIRTALGASHARLLLTVTGEAMVCACCGLAIGTVAASAATHFARSYIYQAGSADWLFMETVAVIVLGSVCGICLLEGRRISHIDPARLLHTE